MHFSILATLFVALVGAIPNGRYADERESSALAERSDDLHIILKRDFCDDCEDADCPINECYLCSVC